MRALLASLFAALAALSAILPAQAQVGDELAAIDASCVSGDFEACVRLGRTYAAAGNHSDALAKFRRACEQGAMSGCHEAAPFYLIGLGGVAANEPFSIELYRLACERDYGPSCTELGRIHSAGAGVGQDDTAANQLFSKACNLGDGAGCTEIGNRYYKAEGGAPKDDVAAFGWFADGCAKGDVQGCVMAHTLETRASEP